MWMRGLISSVFLRLKTMGTNSTPVYVPNYWIRGPGGKAAEQRIPMNPLSLTGSFLRQHCRTLLLSPIIIAARVVRLISLSVRPFWYGVIAKKDYP
jgi:hypothetical protein